jgi:hypothetical protein
MPTGRSSLLTPTARFYQVSAAGGTLAPITALSAGETSHRWPKFLPDGRTLLFVVQEHSPASMSPRWTGRETKVLVHSASDATHVLANAAVLDTCLSARDIVMARPFDPQSSQLMGSVVAVPGTGVASFVATQHWRVCIE